MHAMDAGLPERIERDVMHADEADFLRLWAHQGWVVVGDPVVCGRSADGEAVHRFTLAPTPAASWKPSLAFIEPDVSRDLMASREHESGASAVMARAGFGRMLPSLSAMAWMTARRHAQHEVVLEA
jgi:hypothetical protein